MLLIETVPAGREADIGVFSFGPMNASNTTFTFLGTTNIAGLNFPGTTNLTSVSCPNLVSIDANSEQQGVFSIQNCAAVATLNLPLLRFVDGPMFLGPTNPALPQALTSISLPSLVRVNGLFGIGSTSLTSFSAPLLATLGSNLSISANCDISLPALATVVQIVAPSTFLGSSFSAPVLTTEGGMIFTSCANLVTVNVPSLVPTNTTPITITGAKLNATSVNQILARCVANAAYVAGTVNLSGGTSAAPSGQGVADKATLIGRGVLVTTN